MKNKLKAVHVGISGFPFGKAPINRCLSIYKLLEEEGFDFLIVNNKALHNKDIPLKLEKNGNYSGVKYMYTTPSPYRADSFVKRRYYNLIGRINEFLLLTKRGLSKEIDIMFFYPKNSFFEIIYYSLFSKVFGFSLVSHYVEYRTMFSYKQSKWRNLNYFLFDNYFMKFVDGIIPISEFLIDQIKEHGFKENYIKIPPLIDFGLFSDFNKTTKDNYFLYAGNLIYTDSVNLILESFNLIDNKEFSLYLILHGSSNDMTQIKEKVKNHPKKKLIKVFSNLNYFNYLELLYKAKALLAPLFDRIQDKARFPNKIGEYTATGNPIVSTRIGEIDFYFKDKYNALLSNKSEATEFSKSMCFISEFPEKSKEIGLNGYRTGLKYFDTNSYKESLKKFVIKLINNS